MTQMNLITVTEANRQGAYRQGDFNAQVGRNRDRWHPSLGKFVDGTVSATDFWNFVGMTT